LTARRNHAPVRVHASVLTASADALHGVMGDAAARFRSYRARGASLGACFSKAALENFDYRVGVRNFEGRVGRKVALACILDNSHVRISALPQSQNAHSSIIGDTRITVCPAIASTHRVIHLGTSLGLDLTHADMDIDFGKAGSRVQLAECIGGARIHVEAGGGGCRTNGT